MLLLGIFPVTRNIFLYAREKKAAARVDNKEISVCDLETKYDIALLASRGVKGITKKKLNKSHLCASVRVSTLTKKSARRSRAFRVHLHNILYFYYLFSSHFLLFVSFIHLIPTVTLFNIHLFFALFSLFFVEFFYFCRFSFL